MGCWRHSFVADPECGGCQWAERNAALCKQMSAATHADIDEIRRRGWCTEEQAAKLHKKLNERTGESA